ncbi:nucleic acid-binding protein, partial [Anaeromyces robustus]
MRGNFLKLSELKPGSISSCIGIITDFTVPKITKRNEYYQAISLVDPTTEGKITKLIIFNPNINSFPNVKEKGDIIFCRNVKIQKFNDKNQIISNNQTSFRVFPRVKDPTSCDIEFLIVDTYRNWWKANEINNFNNGKLYSRKVHKISELNDSVIYFDLYCQLIRILDFHIDNCVSALVTDYTENELLEEKIFHENSSIFTKMYLTCTFWDEYANEIKKYSEGDYIFIKNIKVRRNNKNNYFLEGIIHGNSNNWDSLFILEDNDPSIDEIKKNRIKFLENHFEIPSTPPSPLKTSNTNGDKNSLLNDDSLLISENISNLINLDDSFMEKDINPSEMTTSTPKKNINSINDKNLFLSS